MALWALLVPVFASIVGRPTTGFVIFSPTRTPLDRWSLFTTRDENLEEPLSDTKLTANGNGTNLTATKGNTEKESIPNTPCVRICRYNGDFYGGNVCIGCFRDDFDIRNWETFDDTEKLYSIMDALDRWNGEGFPASIDKEFLKRQLAAYEKKIDMKS